MNSLNNIPAVKDIVLIGGGHAHSLVIKMWGMKPIPGLRLTLISPSVYTPYSGMLPGLIAGHYNFQQTHIDLSRLCAWAGVRFIQAEACGLDAEYQQVKLLDRPAIGYDICSLDIGSTPDQRLPGYAEHAVGVKPISRFYQHWQALQKELLAHNEPEPYKVSIIGGGAGGIEVITAMQFWAKQHQCNAEFHLLNRGSSLLPDYPKALQKKLLRQLQSAGIKLHLDFESLEITHKKIQSENKNIPCDKVFYCTQASAADWLKQTALALNDQGFIQINNQLQSTSHNNVFAAGDISHQVDHPRPKAGVYAVRMGPVLFSNLINAALQKPLKQFKPQTDFLSLLALGDKFALGSRKPVSFSGNWVWRWKDHIDQKFMKMFHELPEMGAAQSIPQLDTHLQSLLGIKDIHELAMRCGGCGGKVGATVLSDVLNELKPYRHPDVVVGLNDPDDAAVLNVPQGQQLVQTIDHLKTLIDDPYVFGQLSALHALSDAFAMHAQPQSAQALVQLPMARETIQRRDMQQLMQGALKVLNQHQCALVGGHTSEDTHLNLGFCINALASPKDLLRKQGAKTGQVLILTQPLGTGALFAAHMRAKARGEDIEKSLAFMLQSNQQAAELLYQHQASACTDVTGFGLLGHLVEMLKNTDTGAQLLLNKIPAIPGAIDVMQNGIFSSLQPQNIRLRRAIYNQQDVIQHPHYPLLFDPQTCGGLLATVDKQDAEACINSLIEAGYTQAAIIGEIIELPEQGLIKLETG